MRFIPVSGNREAIVSDEDFERLSLHRWSLSGFKGGYAARAHDGKTVYMHREVLGAKRGQIVDHINRNPLDNRRENLRFCNQSQNNVNGRVGRRNTTSAYRGVSWDTTNNRWRARVHLNGRSVFRGRFRSEEAAARAYDEVALRVFGEFADLNFPRVSE